MNRAIAITLVSLFSMTALADNSGVTKLMCVGTYDNYSSSDLRDIAVKGMYIEITSKRVKVIGFPGFEATYTVVNNYENGIGIQHDSEKNFSGFINRLSGQLWLSETASDGSKKLKQAITATCTKAQTLF